MKGKLIVITGNDGSGKTVQTELLTKRLREEGFDVGQIDFPQYGKTFFADMIARYLTGEFNQETPKNKGDDTNNPQSKIRNPKSVNPYFTSLLYAGDRWESRDKITEWLDEGKIIVSNRYVCCNMAYQGAKIDNKKEKERFFDWANTLEYQVYKMPIPDVVIFLKSDVDVSLALINKRTPREYHCPETGPEESLASNKRHIDIHEEDTDYLKSVQKTYLELASSEDGWKEIECMNQDGKLLDKDLIADEIWNVARKAIQAD
ncbi:MAG: dTMP kinase [Candidatus Anammoxibacter sp.]